ncbi:hypothetical protein MTBLM1_180011 [Rhodospirillaceae bacterium LM-1]|nr:hypothetical protein MTBLM1_180011 [Rhodospirillaceae bacterium LM-1]
MVLRSCYHCLPQEFLYQCVILNHPSRMVPSMAYNLLTRPMIVAALISALLGGCASFEPKDDTAFATEKFEMDRNTCLEQADRLNGSAGNNAFGGMFVGAFVGAGEGAVAGSYQGAAGDGAWIGAAAGAGLGFFIGLGKAVTEYDAAYRQCMEGRQYVQ